MAFCCSMIFCMAQMAMTDSIEKLKKDSIAHAKMISDSIRWEKLFAIAQYPLIKTGGKYSGVVPVNNVEEMPDPKQQYKLLFEVVIANKDSMAKELNEGLTEVARVLNLHVFSGVPAKNIKTVVVVHGSALTAIMNNEAYRKKYQVDNPNLRLLKELEEKAGIKLIACGQAMAAFDIKNEELLPEVKVSVTAQTVLSNYQLKGYVLYSLMGEK